MTDEYTVVPISKNFDNNKIVGELRILTKELPPIADFVFSIGFQTLDACDTKPGDVPNSKYLGRYELVCIGMIPEENYLGYLRQIGVVK